MAKGIQSIRGMHDVLPVQTVVWQQLESELRTLMQSYAYSEIRTPVLENTELFHRSIGKETDIVEKEMYSFVDRNGDSLTMRPEGTASCVRAGIQHGLLYNQQQRLWYMGTMYRHERPQKGRYREFRQLGVEAYGLAGADIEAELIMMGAHLWEKLGLKGGVRLELNTLGTSAERQVYRKALIAYYELHVDRLDEEAKNRLHSNPLRILDSKHPEVKVINVGAPILMDYLGESSRNHFETLKHLLRSGGIDFVVNTRLVRGLDYYCHTVFEWITEDLGAQGTICAGGRYDGLVEQLGGKGTPAVGFAMGLERLLGLLEEESDWQPKVGVDVYVLSVDDQSEIFAVGELLRKSIFDWSIQSHCGGGSLKSQFKKADKVQAKVVLICGGEAAVRNEIVIKPMHGGEQFSIAKADLVVTLDKLLV